MSRKTTHIVPAQTGGWNVKQGGGQKSSYHADTKSDAVDRGRQISKNIGSELIIHKQNGQIQKCDSHGNDPYPPKDKK